MKVIIAGCRWIPGLLALKLVYEAVRISDFRITEVVSGKCAGIDTAGEKWAKLNDVPIKEFPAEWSKHGRPAGYIRNRKMAEYADALIAVWDRQSAGTKNMIDEATGRGLKVFVHYVDPPQK